MRQINRIPDSPGNPYCTAITIDEMGRPVEMPGERGRKKRPPNQKGRIQKQAPAREMEEGSGPSQAIQPIIMPDSPLLLWIMPCSQLFWFWSPSLPDGSKPFQPLTMLPMNSIRLRE